MNYGSIVLATPQSPEVEAAQRWLLTAEGEVRDLRALAQTVYAYDRMDDWVKINDWLGETVQTLSNGGAVSIQSQDLLDFLFVMMRKDRFCEGLLEEYDPVLHIVVCELKKRLPLRTD